MQTPLFLPPANLPPSQSHRSPIAKSPRHRVRLPPHGVYKRHRAVCVRPHAKYEARAPSTGELAETVASLRRRLRRVRERVLGAVKECDVGFHTASVRELEAMSQESGFWGNGVVARGVMRRLGVHEGVLRRVGWWEGVLEEAEVGLELGVEEISGGGVGAVEMLEEVGGLLEGLEGDLGKFEVERLLDGEYDECGCVVTVTAGAGGDDAADWAGMIVRMYERWAERGGFECRLVEWGEAEISGYKWARLEVGGRFAYGYMKGEKGTHRLVRIGPFNAQGKRQTSFAGVDVMPEVGEEGGEVEIGEVEVSTMRAGGKGGQNVNKVESAVRVVHVETGISVRCEKERSQSLNKARAMELLRGKLLAVKEEQRVEELREIRGEVVEAGWGMQIRNYVMHPYKMVKDLRTGVEVGDVGRVLDGDLGPFMDALLQMRSLEKKDEAGV